MRKSDIENLAKRRAKAQASGQIAPEKREGATVRAAGRCGGHLTREDIRAAVRDALLEVGPILARLAAADTIHTVERAPRVFGRALVEAQTATCVMQEAGVAK
jgi:hypothetical protein